MLHRRYGIGLSLVVSGTLHSAMSSGQTSVPLDELTLVKETTITGAREEGELSEDIDLEAVFNEAGLEEDDEALNNHPRSARSNYPSTYTSASYPSTYTSSSYPSTYTSTSYPSTYTSTTYPSTYTSTTYPSTYTSTSYPSTYTSSSYPSTYTSGLPPERDGQRMAHDLYEELPLPLIELNP